MAVVLSKKAVLLLHKDVSLYSFLNLKHKTKFKVHFLRPYFKILLSLDLKRLIKFD